MPEGRARARPLVFGGGQEDLGELTDLPEGAWPMDLEALLRQESGEIARGRPFWLHEAGGSHEVSPQDRAASATFAEGKSRPAGLKTSRGSVGTREPAGQALLAEQLGQHLEEGFRSEIAASLAVEADRGASIATGANLNHPAFACPKPRRAHCWPL